MAANNEAVKIGGFGLVLVFDLDNTLIDTNDMESMKANEQLIKDALNRNIIYNVLRTAENFRTAYPGSIDAILLLTNNDDSVYISKVCKVIADMFPDKRSNFRNIRNSKNAPENSRFINDDKPLFFDYIMMRGNKHRMRLGKNRGLVKNRELVKKMLDILNIECDDIHSLRNRIYFFDDQEHPEMRSQIADGHYIKIKGPVEGGGFIKGTEDLTNYDPIIQEFRWIQEEYGRVYEEIRRAQGNINNTPPNGAPPGAYHPGGAPYESNSENAATGGRRRRYRTLKRKTKKRKTIRRR